MRTENDIAFHIIGAGRGGTSLLAGLLDYHSQLEVGFEKHSVKYLMGKDIQCPNSDIFDARVKAYISACKTTARKHPQSLWGNKITTEQIFGLEDHNTANPSSQINVLDQFLNTSLKGTALIFILRDGRTCIPSKVRRTGQSMEEACDRWLYSAACYHFIEENHARNICIRFEDLLTQPEPILTEICNFLNIPYEKEMLKGTDNEKMLPEYRNSKLDLSKMESITIPEHCMKKMSDELKRCQYQ